MALKIGANQLARIRNAMSKAQGRTAAIAKKGESTVNTIVRTAEVSGAAFALGLAQGKYGVIEVMGVPADLGAGAALHLAAFFGIAGKSSKHLHALADGAMASYFVNLGKGTGLAWKDKAAKTALQGTPGQRLTQGELDKLAQ